MALAKLKKLLNRKAAVAALVAAGLGLGGYKYFKKRAPAEGGEDSAAATVARGSLEIRFTELGDIAAKNTVNVASKVSGRVLELHVQEGAAVKAGDTLAVIQPGKTGAERFLPSTLTAPIDGILLRYVKDENSSSANAKFVEVGEYVTGIFESQNPTYLMTVADMRKVIVKLKINEMDILKLREKMPVDVMVDAIADVKFPATVTMIAPQAEREARGGKFFRVEVALDKNDPNLRTGMTARVDALLEKREDVLKAPLAALFEEKGQELVYLEVEDGKPRQIEVKTGMRTETDVEIVSGLKEGGKILTEKPVEFEPLPEKKEKKSEAPDRSQAREARRKAHRMRRSGS